MSDKRTAEYWREYRAAHREHINALQRERKANLSPERRAALLAYKREYYKRTHPNAGAGKGHYVHHGSLGGMTAEERKAHQAALIAQWREDHPERVRELGRRWNEENRERKRELNAKYRDAHYQQYLAAHREKDRRRRDKTRKGEYKPRMFMRVPEWVACPAQNRHLEQMGAAARMAATTSFACAIQSGLTVGRFAV